MVNNLASREILVLVVVITKFVTLGHPKILDSEKVVEPYLMPLLPQLIKSISIQGLYLE